MLISYGANLLFYSEVKRPDSSVVEHLHGKEKVVSSILTRGSNVLVIHHTGCSWLGSSVG
jgi:hypothetical protein